MLLTATIILGSIASIGFSSAAFIYNKRFETPTNYNTVNLTSYFNGGVGTSENPYLILTPDHLRNLQKLNVLGVFSRDTHFRLDSSIPSTGMVWSGSDLAPIGSEDYPFYSQFDGNGKRINNLVVVGSQTNDIGMFGYAARGSNIRNFILTSPSIYVTSDNNPNHLATTNPLHPLLLAEAQSLNLSLTQKSGTNNAYFSVNKTSVTGQNGVNFNVEYTSSDTSLLYFDSGTNRWVINAPLDAPTGSFTPVQLAARVYGVYQNMIISYTLERWQINVTETGNVNIEDTTNNIKQGYWKTLHDLAGDEIGSGPHETYVGFFVGHLDGEVLNLGLYGGTSSDVALNAKLYISGRMVRSYSTLIGRTVNDAINDDANAKFVNRVLDFDTVIRDTSNIYPAYPSGSAVIPTTASSLGTSSGTQYSTYNTYARNVSAHYGISTTEYAYTRIYPGLTDSTYSEGGDTSYMLNVGGPLEGYLVSMQYSTFLYGTYRMPNHSFLRNGIWIYMSTSNPSWSNFFSTNATSYEAKIKIRYVATGSDENRFQILYNSYNPSADPTYWLYPTAYYGSGDSLNNLETLTANGQSVYDSSEHPIILKDEQSNPITGVVEQELNFIYTTATFGFGSYYDLVLGVGVGRTYQGSQVTVGTTTSGNYMTKSHFDLNTSGFSLKILSLDLFFTSLNGTVSRQVTNTEYLNSFPTFNASNQTWTGWPSASNVRINFDVLTSTINNTGQFANYRFYRQASVFLSSSRVYGIQNVTSTAWNLQNGDGYASAEFSSGTW